MLVIYVLLFFVCPSLYLHVCPAFGAVHLSPSADAEQGVDGRGDNQVDVSAQVEGVVRVIGSGVVEVVEVLQFVCQVIVLGVVAPVVGGQGEGECDALCGVQPQQAVFGGEGRAVVGGGEVQAYAARGCGCSRGGDLSGQPGVDDAAGAHAGQQAGERLHLGGVALSGVQDDAQQSGAGLQADGGAGVGAGLDGQVGVTCPQVAYRGQAAVVFRVRHGGGPVADGQAFGFGVGQGVVASRCQPVQGGGGGCGQRVVIGQHLQLHVAGSGGAPVVGQDGAAGVRVGQVAHLFVVAGGQGSEQEQAADGCV